MAKNWPIRISGTGTVSYKSGNRYLAVPHGDYTMRETEDGYEISGPAGTFVLATTDVDQYVENKTLKVLYGDWP